MHRDVVTDTMSSFWQCNTIPHIQTSLEIEGILLGSRPSQSQGANDASSGRVCSTRLNTWHAGVPVAESQQ